MNVAYKVLVTWLLGNIVLKGYGNLQWFGLIESYIPMEPFWVFADASVILANLFAVYMLLKDKLHTALVIPLVVGVLLNIVGYITQEGVRDSWVDYYWEATNVFVAMTSIVVVVLVIRSRGNILKKQPVVRSGDT